MCVKKKKNENFCLHLLYDDMYMRENTLARRLRVDSHAYTCVCMHLSGQPPHCGGNSLLLIDCHDPGNPPVLDHPLRVCPSWSLPHHYTRTRPHVRTPSLCAVRFSHGFAPKIVCNYRRTDKYVCDDDNTDNNAPRVRARLSHSEKQYVNNIARGIVLPDDIIIIIFVIIGKPEHVRYRSPMCVCAYP